MWQVSRAERRDIFIFNLANDTAIPSADLFRITAKALRVTGIELMKEDALQQRSLTGLERLFTRQVQFQAPTFWIAPSLLTPLTSAVWCLTRCSPSREWMRRC